MDRTSSPSPGPRKSLRYNYTSVQSLWNLFYSNKKRNLENLASGEVELSEADLVEIDELLAKTSIKGGRYNDSMDPKMLRLWG